MFFDVSLSVTVTIGRFPFGIHILRIRSSSSCTNIDSFSTIAVKSSGIEKFTTKINNVRLSDDQIKRIYQAQLQLVAFIDSKKGLD